MPLGSHTKRAPDPRRRRRVLLAAGVVLAVAVFVLLPGFLSAQPGFFERYPGLADRYEPWAASTHVEAGCEGCHVPPGLFSQAAYRTRMVGEFYVSLASRDRVPNVFRRPTNEACLVCHSDLRSVSPRGDLQIPHRAHVSVLKMDCVACHTYLVHELSPEGKHTPPMIGCLTCHDGDTAKDNCTACHTNKAAPESHAKSDWLVLHGGHAADAECATCHKWKDDWCVDCHTGRPTSHGADWRSTHGIRIAEHRSCEACHEAAFCIRCHGDFPPENLNPALKLVK